MKINYGSNNFEKKQDHNWKWINENRIIAKQFEKDHCPFKKQNDDILEKISCNLITTDEIYNQTNHNDNLSVRLKAYDIHIECSIIYPKKCPKNTLSCPLTYDQPISEFKSKLVGVFEVLKKVYEKNRNNL